MQTWSEMQAQVTLQAAHHRAGQALLAFSAAQIACGERALGQMESSAGFRDWK
jgi:hypothetical protein